MSQDNWIVIGVVAQLLQAIVVLVGGSLIYWQLKQLLVEQKHRKWEALRWGLTLLEPFARRDSVLRMFSPEIETDELYMALNNLKIVSLAVHDNYISRDLLLEANGRELAGAFYLYWSARKEVDSCVQVKIDATASPFFAKLTEREHVYRMLTVPPIVEALEDRMWSEGSWLIHHCFAIWAEGNPKAIEYLERKYSFHPRYENVVF